MWRSSRRLQGFAREYETPGLKCSPFMTTSHKLPSRWLFSTWLATVWLIYRPRILHHRSLEMIKGQSVTLYFFDFRIGWLRCPTVPLTHWRDRLGHRGCSVFLPTVVWYWPMGDCTLSSNFPCRINVDAEANASHTHDDQVQADDSATISSYVV